MAEGIIYFFTVT